MTSQSTDYTPISDGQPGSSYVEWSAVFAGAILASAIVVLMTAFGSAIGLSLVSPYHGSFPILFYVVLALWFAWITVSSFVAGGYLTGRLRRPIAGTTPHEVQIRDGAHGLVVWAVAVVIGTALATFSLSSAVTTGSLSSALKGADDLKVTHVSTMASMRGPKHEIMGYVVDSLFRHDGSATEAASAIRRTPLVTSRRSASQILANGATQGSLSGDDRMEIARAVSVGAGLSQSDAERRADMIFGQLKAAGERLREATEAARRAGIVLGVSIAGNFQPVGAGSESTPGGDQRGSITSDRTIEGVRQEVAGILEVSATNGRLSDEDHTYLVRLIREHANVSQAVAEKRVDMLSEKMDATAKSDLLATEMARKGGVLLAFLTTATMILGAAAAWWGAGVGGRHRDENFDASHLTRW